MTASEFKEFKDSIGDETDHLKEFLLSNCSFRVSITNYLFFIAPLGASEGKFRQLQSSRVHV